MIDMTSMRFEEATKKGRVVHEVRLTFHEDRWMARIITLPAKMTGQVTQKELA
jgi:hypothetical protein